MLTQISNKHPQETYIERTSTLPKRFGEIIPVAYIPEEYTQLIIPYASVYFEKTEGATILSQQIQCGDFSIWFHDVIMSEPIVLRPYTTVPIWSLHFLFDVSEKANLYEIGENKLKYSECNLINICQDSHHRIPVQDDQQLFLFHVNFSPDAIHKLAVHHPVLCQLSSKKAGNVSSILNERPFRINPVCELLIRSILSCRFMENIANYYLKRCCIDLLINFACQDMQSSSSYIPTEENTFSTLFDYLVKNPHKDHTAEELSGIFSLDENYLRSVFRKYASIPIDYFFKMNKMMLIFNLIVHSKSRLATIASIAGFKNTPELEEAFRVYYDCDISILRNAM